MNRRGGRLLWALCTAIGLWHAAANPVLAQSALPADRDLQAAHERMGAALSGVGAPSRPGHSVVPEWRSLPQPVSKSPDIAEMVEGHWPAQRPTGSFPTPGTDSPELMIFISFSLPKETLQRIVRQSERTGAVLVLRGLKEHSLTRMGEAVAQLVGKHPVTVIIHPPAFKQFAVRQVPSLVLARSAQAAQIGEDGCAPASSFIRVDGDVSQDYALDLIERQAPTWADLARRCAARLSAAAP